MASQAMCFLPLGRASARAAPEWFPLVVSDARKLKALEEENRRLKHIVADLTLDVQMLKAVNAKKW